jgi:hypothetical protein
MGDEVIPTKSIFVGERRKDCESPYYVICNSVPKAGTYLLVELVKALGRHVDIGYHTYTSSIAKVHKDGRMDTARAIPARLWASALEKGYLCASHVEYEPYLEHYFLSRKEHKMLFIVRDPRDLVISWVDFLYSSLSCVKMRKWNEVLRQRGKRSHPTDATRITSTINSLPTSGIMNFLSWIDSPACLTVRFEDLYLELTGPTMTDHPILDGICDYLEVPRTQPGDLREVLGAGLTESGREQKIEIYKRRMSEEHFRMLREERFQKMVVEFGYEVSPEFDAAEALRSEPPAPDAEKRIAAIVAEREQMITAIVAEREQMISKLVKERDDALARQPSSVILSLAERLVARFRRGVQ